MIHSWPNTNREEWLSRRKANVNASEAAALFGPEIHPYLTPYKLWALKCEKISDEADSKILQRGRKFEPVVVDILREDYPDWNFVPAHAYFWDDSSRLGATPDVYATRPDVYGSGLIQIKTVGQFAFQRRWRDEHGEIAVPTWVAVQASIEAYLTGSTWAGVAAMKLGDGGIEIAYIDIPLKPHLIHRIEDLTGEFWRRVAENEPYDPDFGKDRKVVFDLYEEGHGPIIDLTPDVEFREILNDRAQLKQVEKAGEDATNQRKILDARIIHKLANAPGARCGSRVVSVKVIKKKAYSVKPTQYPLVSVKGVDDGSGRSNDGGI
jgi:YqaJ-like viral recombinase domain